MGKQSAIEWTHSSFSPWWGCQKVSPACANCYAEDLAHRFRHDVWGPEAPRRFFADRHWDEPLKWDRHAARDGVQWRVFCGSMCDILEDRDDVLSHRIRLWELIEKTPHLTWLLLTKRPDRFKIATPTRWWSPETWPQHAWVGTTVETQEWADRRTPALLEVPARVRFLSCEPLLSELKIMPYLVREFIAGETKSSRAICGTDYRVARLSPGVSWVIAGGESGPHARPMDVAWVRHLRDQCLDAGIPFFFKQGSEANWPRFKEFSSFPQDLQIREVPA